MNFKISPNLRMINYQYLLSELEIVRWKLKCRIAQITNQPFEQEKPTIDSSDSQINLPLDYLCQIFNLSQFEREILLLCMGMELDLAWSSGCAKAQMNSSYNFPTFSLAQSIFEMPDWNAIAPESPLRYWKLIEVEEGIALTLSPLRIDERILHFILGNNQLDKHFLGIIKPFKTHKKLVNSHQKIIQKIIYILNNNLYSAPLAPQILGGKVTQSLSGSENLGSRKKPDKTPPFLETSISQSSPKWGFGGKDLEGKNFSINISQELNLPVIQLYGNEPKVKREISANICHQLNLDIYRISSQVLPTNLDELNQLIQLWRREAILSQAVLLLEIDPVVSIDSNQENAIAHFIEEMDTLLIISRQDRQPQQHRQVITFEVNKPTAQEQQNIWHQTLREQNINLDGFIDQLVAQFNLSTTEIQSVTQQLSSSISPDLPLEYNENNRQITQQIWQICRAQAQPQMDELAQPIQATASWDDLVLPELQKQTLHHISTHVKQRMTVYEQWGFTQKGKRGLGISALFAGASGTGKTMAAEVIAKELHLDLYRIDLSSVVSKYIGETEKNLRQVFDKAETGGAILLFDEADALFGKRSDVKDSRDRYANLEVSYLLQRMETYRGLAILTTNLKESIDNAFMRRIRFIVKFPLPDATQRAEIWRRIFPEQTPTQELDFRKLAKLNLPGGNIRNIALNAAFLAADARESVTMAHLLQAAESEYAKLERPLTDTEVKGWI